MDFLSAVFASNTLEPLSYFTNNAAPHGFTNDIWSTFLQPPPDDELQMQHLRYPTPPHTPPRSLPAKLQSDHPRTQSVIMKVGQGYSVQRICTELSTLGESRTSNYGAAEPTTSDSSHPSSECVCDWTGCGRPFKDLDSLVVHVTQIHSVPSLADGLYYCHWSGCQRTNRGFNARYKMLVHVRTHTKEKPHQCHLCDKGFSRAENLKIHIRSHSGEKPYICTYEGCHKAYSNSSDRFKHTRTHSMEKPYMCKVPGCQKRYTDPSSLRKHVKTFKHMSPLGGAAAISGTGHSSTLYSPSLEPDNLYHRCINGEPQNTAYLCIPSADAAQYYVGMNSEDVCPMREPHLTCYYSKNLTNTECYWIAEEPDIGKPSLESRYALHPEGFALELDLETPLDLRVNRR